MDIKNIKNIKDKRNKVACELRKLAKQNWMSIDIDDIHQMIFWYSSSNYARHFGK